MFKNVHINSLKSLSLKISSAKYTTLESQPIFFASELICVIWERSLIPDELTDITLYLIFKKVDTSDPNNWRPVYILDVTYKVITDIIVGDGLEERCGCF